MAPKRIAEAKSARSPAKKSRVDPTTEKCEAVVEALDDLAEGLPASCIKMLTSGAPSALTVNAAERHDTQSTIVGMIGEVLSGIDKRLETDVLERQTPVQAFSEVKSGLDAKVADKESEHEAFKGAVAHAKEVLTAHTTAVGEAAQALKQLKLEQDQGDAILNKTEAKKQELESTRNDVFNPLKETAAQGKDGLKTLHKIGKKYNFDNTLLCAIDTIFAKEMGERGSFDHMVITQYEASLNTNIDTLAKELAEGEPGKTARAAAVATATENKAEKDGILEASKGALAEAIVAEKAGKEASQAAKRDVADFFPDMKVGMDALDAAKAKLNSFRDGALAGYHQLKDLAPVAEEAEGGDEKTQL